MKNFTVALLAGTLLVGTSLVAIAAEKQATKPMASASPMATKVKEMATVKITAPKANESVKGMVKVMWNFKKAGHAAHVHLYVDSKLLGPQMSDWKELKDLKPGSHIVKVVAATSNHKELGPQDTVTFTVAK